VDQEFALFEDTIADNIRLWDRTSEDFEMILAARDAQIYDTIVMREQGFYDPLIEGGRNLSGGQRQRIEIARALAQEPIVLIMDESTSALDAKPEQDVMNAIRMRGCTCILVAHRLSTIRDCDEIIVMDEGKIVERGTHQELYEAGGLYKELVSDA
jgi:ABC-type multidrug transport system fused ATPase/permease subunit